MENNKSAAAHKINVETTAYEGDVAFPEAEHYPEFVAAQLAERFPNAEIDVSIGSKTRVTLYGFRAAGDSYLEHDIETQVKVEFWDAFCADGYKAYSS